jgi:hypothetical protein
MHFVEQKIIQRFANEPAREISTSELVKSVFIKEYEEIKHYIYNEQRDRELVKIGKRKKARLHRKLLYHLGVLTKDNILKVTRLLGKGEKYFAINSDKEVLRKKDAEIKNVLESVSSSNPDLFVLSGLESYEEQKIINRFDPQNWIAKINSLFIESDARSTINDLYLLLTQIYPNYNDCAGLLNFNVVIDGESLENLNAFVKKVNIDTRDYNKYLNLIIDLSKIKDSVKLTDFISSFAELAPERVYIIFQTNSRALSNQTRFMRLLIKNFSEKKIRINIQNTDLHAAPYMIGRAGAYTLQEDDWEEYLKHIRGKTIGLCCSQTSIYIDYYRFFKNGGSMSDFRELIQKAAKALLLATTTQRKKSDILFKPLNDLNSKSQNRFFLYSQNYIRIWNYELSGEEDETANEFSNFESLLKAAVENLDEFCKREETIFKSCGIPIRYKIVLSSAFKRFDAELLSPRAYNKITIKGSSDFHAEGLIRYIHGREQLFKIFQGGDRVRFFRTPNFVPDDIITEINFILNSYDLHLFSYDFKSRKGDVTLDNFM